MEEEVRRATEEVRDACMGAAENVERFCARVATGEVSLSGGNSLLELKAREFLSYVTMIVTYMGLKLAGEQVRDHPLIDSLIEARVVLEKIAPVEEKARYQIDRMITIASGKRDMDEETMHAPNLAALTTGEEGEEGEEGREEQDAGDGKYRPPRLGAVQFTDTYDKQLEKEKRREEREKERARRGAGVQELLDEFTDRPEEYVDAQIGSRSAKELKRLDDEVKRHEENYFVRLNVTKDMKQRRKELQRRARAEELGGGDLRELISISDRVRKSEKKRRSETLERDALAARAMASESRRVKQKRRR